MNVGFIGLGIMGGSMALNIRNGGHEMVVHDLRQEAATPLLEAGAQWADNPQQVAQSSEVVFHLPLPALSRSKPSPWAKSGLLAGMSPGQAYFDLSTNSPTVVRRINQAFTEKGVDMLDAPVSGGPRGARTGKLAIWVGGDREVFDRCLPLLQVFSDQPFYVGPIGCGSVAKLVHNCTGYIVQTALAEVFTMGVKAGVEPLALWQAVRQGAQGRRGTFEGLAEHLLPGNFDPPDFALRLAHKDVDLAVSVGREYAVPMRLANLALQELTEAMVRGWADRDSRVAMLLQEERANVQVRAPEDRLREILDS